MSQVSNTYFFDASMYFINFTSGDAEEDTENVDSWFDKKASLENNFSGKNGLQELFQNSVKPLKPVSNTYYKGKENLIEHSIPSNPCSSLEVEGTISRNVPDQPQRRSVRLITQKDLDQKEKCNVQMKAKRCATPEMISEIPPSKKMKVKNQRRNQRMDTLNFIPYLALLRSWKMLWVFLKRYFQSVTPNHQSLH
uniref:Aurora-A binding domain-containing protein n=1 Tax=Castor canadensis TaxID=51338 RepID=A0A8C0WFK1_CASCN